MKQNLDATCFDLIGLMVLDLKFGSWSPTSLPALPKAMNEGRAAVK